MPARPQTESIGLRMRLQLDFGAAVMLTLSFVDDDPLVADVFEEALNQMRNHMIDISRTHWKEEEVDRTFRFEEMRFRLRYAVDGHAYVLTELSKNDRASSHNLRDGMTVTPLSPVVRMKSASSTKTRCRNRKN